MEEKLQKQKVNIDKQKNNQKESKTTKKIRKPNSPKMEIKQSKKKSEKTKESAIIQKDERLQKGKFCNKNNRNKNPFLTKLAVRIVTIVLLAVIFMFVGTIAIKKITKVNYESKFTLVNQQLSYCQELITMKFQYSDIVSLKKSMGFSKSYSIVKYSGIIRVGIENLLATDARITKDGKEVRIKLPPVTILGNEITKQEVFDEKQSIFVPITTQEIFEEIENARIQMQEDLIAEGIMEESQRYTTKVIEQFLYSSGFEKVKVE